MGPLSSEWPQMKSQICLRVYRVITLYIDHDNRMVNDPQNRAKINRFTDFLGETNQ